MRTDEPQRSGRVQPRLRGSIPRLRKVFAARRRAARWQVLLRRAVYRNSGISCYREATESSASRLFTPRELESPPSNALSFQWFGAGRAFGHAGLIRQAVDG
jgi:hypothetical protein